MLKRRTASAGFFSQSGTIKDYLSSVRFPPQEWFEFLIHPEEDGFLLKYRKEISELTCSDLTFKKLREIHENNPKQEKFLITNNKRIKALFNAGFPCAYLNIIYDKDPELAQLMVASNVLQEIIESDKLTTEEVLKGNKEQIISLLEEKITPEIFKEFLIKNEAQNTGEKMMPGVQPGGVEDKAREIAGGLWSRVNTAVASPRSATVNQGRAKNESRASSPTR